MKTRQKLKPNLYNLTNGKTRKVIEFIENKPNPFDYHNYYNYFIKFERLRNEALNQVNANNMLFVFEKRNKLLSEYYKN